jgi:polyisoprenoid-binding protein YceI
MSATTVDTLPAAGVWSIDSAHSTANFSVRHHAVATFRSSFTNITGAYDGDAGRLTGRVEVADITLTGLDRLKGHILTPDFFNADEHPTFSFESTKISHDGESLIIEGDLTLRGVTRPVVASGSVRGPQTVRHGDGRVTDRLGIDLVSTIDRREFDITFNNEVAEGIVNLGWDVQIDVALELQASSDT